MRLTARIEGLAELQRDWHRGLVEIAVSVVEAVDKGTSEGAHEARTNHRYEDRTAALTKSISGRVTGRALGVGGAATGEIVAMAPYARYVDEGTAPHVIRPKAAKGFVGPLHRGQSRRSDKGAPRSLLIWVDQHGVKHAAPVVHHPGTKPYGFMAVAYIKCERVMVREIEIGIARARRIIEL
ncbi:hypothetical protein LZC95_08020 [Pendulispora brunnea]|uniref:HK97 gp10 family phage protein n=1 Tax=Pendulispora brunnea TaxID=2905690 RepID=A0ABZ2KDK0_9BACT